MPGALSGIRVVDLTWGVAGPMAVMQLADHGADVVKVEPPGGDPFRAHPGSVVWLRGRRSIELDLKTDEGRDVMAALLERADVLVDSFSPGVMDRLGFGPDALAQRYPRLVSCSIPAYPSGHRLADRPGYDALVQARSGQQWEQPGWRDGPIHLHLPMPSMAAQFLAHIGIVAALTAREETGKGQHVETSLYQGALLFTTMLWQDVERADAGYHGIMAKSHPPGVHQGTVFECAPEPERLDRAGKAGEWIHAATMNGLKPTASQEEVLGLQEGEALPDAFRRHDRDELVERFHEANLGAEAVVPPEDAFDHPQLLANGTFADVGGLTQVGVVVQMEKTPGTPGGPDGRPCPEPGEHTDEILAELGLR